MASIPLSAERFALLAYAVWPTWERNRLPELIRGADGCISEFVSRRFAASYLSLVGIERERERTRQAARIARSNLETSIERLAAEPGVTAAQLAQGERDAGGVASVRTRDDRPGGGNSGRRELAPRPEFQTFANAVEKTLELLAAKLRGKRIAEREFPDLRAAYTNLTQAGDPQLTATGW